MTCNTCEAPCECGAEEAAGLRLLADERARLERLSRQMTPDEWAVYTGMAPRFPELESIEAALNNYNAGAKEAA